MAKDEDTTIAAEVRESPDGFYELGAEIDGTWIGFSRVPVTQVQAAQANKAENDSNAAEDQG